MPTIFINEGQLKAVVPTAQVTGVGTAVVSVSNPIPGGGLSTNSLSFTITPVGQNPIPSLNEINPKGATAGSGAVTIDLFGTNFMPASQVRLNGSNRPTIFVAPNYLRVTLSASDVAQPGTAGITVVNPAPGGGTSNVAAFNVAAPGKNPVPSLASVSPATAMANDPTMPGTKMTLIGSNFTPDSEVLWNGSSRYTTFINDTELRISLKAGDVDQAGTASVQVRTPGPGGGPSNSMTFLVTAPGDNPLPAVTGFSPAVGNTLIIRGSGFVPGSQVQWNGVNRSKTYLSSTEIRIQLTMAEINADTAVIQVINLPAGGGASNLFVYSPVRVYLPLVIK